MNILNRILFFVMIYRIIKSYNETKNEERDELYEKIYYNLPEFKIYLNNQNIINVIN
jgi:hypothetical protein